MIYLDTSTCVGLLRGDIKVNPAVWRNYSPKEFGIPVIVESELIIAAAQSGLLKRTSALYVNSCCLFRKSPTIQNAANCIATYACGWKRAARPPERTPSFWLRCRYAMMLHCSPVFPTCSDAFRK